MTPQAWILVIVLGVSALAAVIQIVRSNRNTRGDRRRRSSGSIGNADDGGSWFCFHLFDSFGDSDGDGGDD